MRTGHILRIQSIEKGENRNAAASDKHLGAGFFPTAPSSSKATSSPSTVSSGSSLRPAYCHLATTTSAVVDVVVTAIYGTPY